MSIPMQLRPGYVSIYGNSGSAGLNAVVPPNSNFLFGLVDQTWNGVGNDLQVGQSVFYDLSQAKVTIVYANWPYVIIQEDKIIGVETTPP